MSDYSLSIELTDLRFHAFHGVLEQERTVGNEFRVDLNIRLRADDLSECRAESEVYSSDSGFDDNLRSTISYATVYEEVNKAMQTPCRLLETVAYNIMERLRRYDRIERAEVRVEKCAPPIPGFSGHAAVKIEWPNRADSQDVR